MSKKSNTKYDDKFQVCIGYLILGRYAVQQEILTNGKVDESSLQQI